MRAFQLVIYGLNRMDYDLTIISFWLYCSGNLDIHRMTFYDLYASFPSFLIHI